MSQQQASESFKKHLRRQLGFLQRSCDSFDSGHSDEAIRMATVLRVMLHDTRASTSLLTHLGARDIRLLDTCAPISPMAVMAHGLGMLELGGPSARLLPNLDMTPSKSFKSSIHWWEQLVFILNPSTRLRRKDIVLAAANKDGGAHVDATLTPEYEALAAEGALGWYRSPVAQDVVGIQDGHLVAIRQMGYEVLNSPELLAIAE